MSHGVNRVYLLGNLGADPELKTTTSGSILKLRMATTHSVPTKGGGEHQDQTEWHSVIVWGKRGEGLAKFLSKGDPLFVEGSLRTTHYDKDGSRVYRTDIVAREISLLGKRQSDNAPREPWRPHQIPKQPDPYNAPHKPQKSFDEIVDEDNIPF